MRWTRARRLPRLETSPRDSPRPAELLARRAARCRTVQVLPLARQPRRRGGQPHHDLMQGSPWPPGGAARRLPAAGGRPRGAGGGAGAPLAAATYGLRRPRRRRRGDRSERLLAQIGPHVGGRCPTIQPGRRPSRSPSQYARLGQWSLAREAFLLLVNRYPTHPLTAEAYRWLIRHNTSSEARRRHELGQFRRGRPRSSVDGAPRPGRGC